VPRHDDEEPAALLREGLDLIRKGRAMVRAAENMGAVAHLGPAMDNTNSVDFASLPGRSPEARAEALYLGRRLRDGLFPRDLFGEPAWDLLLAVFLAQREGKVADAEDVLRECGVTKATGMRYVAFLIELGFVLAGSEEGEPRELFLSTTGLRTMRRFFELTEGGVPVRKDTIERRRVSSSE